MAVGIAISFRVCKILSPILLGTFISLASFAEESSIKCQLYEGKKGEPTVTLKLDRAPSIANSEEQPKLSVAAIEISSKSEKKLFGIYQHYQKNILDIERIDYEPLGLLGLMEGDIFEATFYMAKEDQESRDLDLSIVSIYTQGKDNKPVYGGSYGNYFGHNLICFAH
jgi:hypothetical protein